ncbi:MAG: trypsin-like peptidase domain-containing protein, partial [Woeseiaceae bacterium]
MARLKSIFIFLLQSIVVGLAVAFVVILLRPQLLPAINGTSNAQATNETGRAVSYADAVDISAPAVANVYTRRLVQSDDDVSARDRVRSNTSLGSAVVIDPEGYLVTNFHVVADAAEIRVQMADGRIADPEVVGYDAETDLALLKVDLGT